MFELVFLDSQSSWTIVAKSQTPEYFFLEYAFYVTKQTYVRDCPRVLDVDCESA